MDTAALARLKDDLVQAERAHAELASQGEKPLAALRVKPGRGDPFLHRIGIISR